MNSSLETQIQWDAGWNDVVTVKSLASSVQQMLQESQGNDKKKRAKVSHGFQTTESKQQELDVSTGVTMDLNAKAGVAGSARQVAVSYRYGYMKKKEGDDVEAECEIACLIDWLYKGKRSLLCISVKHNVANDWDKAIKELATFQELWDQLRNSNGESFKIASHKDAYEKLQVKELQDADLVFAVAGLNVTDEVRKTASRRKWLTIVWTERAYHLTPESYSQITESCYTPDACLGDHSPSLGNFYKCTRRSDDHINSRISPLTSAG